MRDNDYGAGFVMLIVAVGSLVVGILAILLRARLARTQRGRSGSIGFTSGAAPVIGALVGGFVGFFVVAFFPRFLVAAAGVFWVGASRVWKIRGVEARNRALLLVALGFLWLGLAIYGDRMKQWEQTVSGPIRVDLVVTASLAAVWSFLGVWLRREVDLQEEAEESNELAEPEGPLAAGIRRR